jgi:hypothetical protein
MMRIARRLPLLVTVPLLVGSLAATSPAVAAGAGATRSCGSFKVDGWPVSKVHVANATCAQAKRIMVRYHETGQGLSCFTFSDDSPIHIRCKGRVAVPRSGPSGPAARRPPRWFVEAIINFSLPDCAAAGDCGI